MGILEWFFSWLVERRGVYYMAMKKILADRMKYIDSSGIRKVFALAAQMKDPINFSIGQPDFDTPEAIKREAIQAIERGVNKYSQTAGDEELLAKIGGGLEAEFGWKKPKLMITSGVSGGILLSFLALINPGDEVIIPDPYFVMYKHLVNMLGGKCVFVDCYPDFKVDPGRIEDAVTDKTKMIIINSPSNPTGAVLGGEQLKDIADIASKNNIIVLSDEIYEKFSYDGPCESIVKYCDRAILLRGFGKTYGVTGWRLGYAAAHSTDSASSPQTGSEVGEIIDQMIKIQQYTFVCAPSPFQKAIAAAMDYDVTSIVNAYRKKRDLIYEGLKDKFEIVKPAGAFYAFVKAPGGQASKFVEKAIANNILVIPGNVFSEKDTHFRISYATSDDKICKGIEILRKMA
jgi:aspartate aminotransferase